MRDLLKHIAWAFATAAMLIATPMQAAARTTAAPDIAGVTTATITEAPGTTSVSTTAHDQPEAGRGWAELYCMTCVGVGSFVLYSGGISMLPLLLGHTGTISTLTGSCLLACESAIKSLLK